jgi:hypothetical protein
MIKIWSFQEKLALVVFLVLAPWWPNQESDRTETYPVFEANGFTVPLVFNHLTQLRNPIGQQ